LSRFASVRESPCQHSPPQRLRALQVCVDLRLNLADDREAAVYFGDDAVLLGKWRDWDGKPGHLAGAQRVQA